MIRYRHELKHRLDFCDLLVLRQRLRAVMQSDHHARDGTYFIRSIYFDDPADTALQEKMDGINCRDKYRLRYYNLDPSMIHLEKKSKRSGLGTKQSANISASDAQAIIDGNIAWMLDDPQPLVRELYCRIKNEALRPKTVVDYTREAFVFAPGNVRVTLDHHIRTGLFCTDFLDPQLPTVAVADDPIILEVKWDDFLPQIIQDIVQLEHRQASAFSKYAACRTYD